MFTEIQREFHDFVQRNAGRTPRRIILSELNYNKLLYVAREYATSFDPSEATELMGMKMTVIEDSMNENIIRFSMSE